MTDPYDISDIVSGGVPTSVPPPAPRIDPYDVSEMGGMYEQPILDFLGHSAAEGVRALPTAVAGLLALPEYVGTKAYEAVGIDSAASHPMAQEYLREAAIASHQRAQEAAQAMAAQNQDPGMNDTLLRRVLGSTAQSAPAMATGFGLGGIAVRGAGWAGATLTRASTAGIAVLPGAGVEGAQTTGEDLAAGLPWGRAVTHGALNAGMEAGGELLPLGKLIGPESALIRRMGGQAVPPQGLVKNLLEIPVEAAQEGITGAGQATADVALDPNQYNLRSALKKIGSDTLDSTLAGAVMAGPMTGLNVLAEKIDERRQQRAFDQTQQRIASLSAMNPSNAQMLSVNPGSVAPPIPAAPVAPPIPAAPVAPPIPAAPVAPPIPAAPVAPPAPPKAAPNTERIPNDQKIDQGQAQATPLLKEPAPPVADPVQPGSVYDVSDLVSARPMAAETISLTPGNRSPAASVTPSEAPAQQQVAAPVEPPAVSVAKKTTIDQVRTSTPATVTGFRGEGKPKSDVYNYADTPILGPGLYIARTHKEAQGYGDQISEQTVSMRNPLVITNDTEWRALTRLAGWKYANPYGLARDEVNQAGEQLRKHVIGMGHDGLVINPSEDGDSARTLFTVVGHAQAVSYAKPAAHVAPSEAPAQQQQVAAPVEPPAVPVAEPPAVPVAEPPAVPVAEKPAEFQNGQRVRFTKGKKAGTEATITGKTADGRLVLRTDDGKTFGGKDGITPGNVEVMSRQSLDGNADASTDSAPAKPAESSPNDGQRTPGNVERPRLTPESGMGGVGQSPSVVGNSAERPHEPRPTNTGGGGKGGEPSASPKPSGRNPSEQPTPIPTPGESPSDAAVSGVAGGPPGSEGNGTADSGDTGSGQPRGAGGVRAVPGADATGRDTGPGRDRAGDSVGVGGEPSPSGRDESNGEPAGAGGRGDPAGRSSDPVASSPFAGRPDYHMADPNTIMGSTGPKARFARNRAAIETFQQVDAENRAPTAAEMDTVAAYIGWGSFGQELFQGTWASPRPHESWTREDTWLRQSLGEESWTSAQASIINAHFTDPFTVSAMWDVIRHLGFTGGRVLEPSMGIGNFFALMPRDMHAQSHLTGIELEPQTGAMARMLHTNANVQIKGYQNSATADNFYDLAIGNVPFGDITVADPRYDRFRASIHNYFFMKALDQVRPGGLVAFITSSFTLDGVKAERVREYLAAKGDLVGAFRLPTGAFKQYAGTSVVTDLIIIQKRALGDPPANLPIWTGVPVEMDTPGGKVKVNPYFRANPSHILGTLNMGHGTTFRSAGMIVDRPDDLEQRLRSLSDKLPANIMTLRDDIGKAQAKYIANNTDNRQGELIEIGGDTHIVEGDHLRAWNEWKLKAKNSGKKNASRLDGIKRLIGIRAAYGKVLDVQRSNDNAAIKKAMAEMNRQYDEFTASHGPINQSDAITQLKDAKDPSVARLKALEAKENGEWVKRPVFVDRQMRALKVSKNLSVGDAYAVARNESLNLRLDRIAELANAPVEQVKAELIAANQLFKTPIGTYEPADVYLAGNVRQKLREAEDATVHGMIGLERSAAALRDVIPKDIPYTSVEVKMGATWVSSDDYSDFLSHLLNEPAEQFTVARLPDSWKVIFERSSLNGKVEATKTWGHERVPFSRMMNAAINNLSVKVNDPGEDGAAPTLNVEATEAANAKIEKIREEFKDWLWTHPLRATRLERAYNDTFNAIVNPKYDGSHLALDGLALMRGDSPFAFRQHQVNAVWRGILTGRGLYAHEVGTGKTYTMAGLVVESRRLGLARKPLILAHNANSSDVHRDLQAAYPGARFNYVDNLSPEKRNNALQQIVTDDWDGVIMPHSLLDRLTLRPETVAGLLREQIKALEAAAYEAVDEEGGNTDALKDVFIQEEGDLDIKDKTVAKKLNSLKSPTAKELVKSRFRLTAQITRARQLATAGAIPIEDMGIDMLVVDEAHIFKKLPIATKMKLKGLNTTASDAGTMLMMISDYIRTQNNGRGVHLFTGTPITNTVNEIYNMQRLTMAEDMRRDGVLSWDGWFNNFAAAVDDVELTSGGTWDTVTRLTAFVNVPELRRMAGRVMDTVFASDMPEFVPRPETEGLAENPVGRPHKRIHVDTAPMSADQMAQNGELKARYEIWTKGSKQDRKEWMKEGAVYVPVIIESEGVKSAMDGRTITMSASGDDPNLKINRLSKNLMKVYREDAGSTQMIFMQTGYSDTAERTIRPIQRDPVTGKSRKETVAVFNMAQAIIDKLVAEGIPRSEIAVMSWVPAGEKRAAIAAKMRSGEIRVAIGGSETMGTGINAQNMLRAMHHLDAPWMPGHMEQRNGRGHRQGNFWNTVLEFRYLTEASHDGRRWQVLLTKSRFITKFMRDDLGDARVIEGDATNLDEEGGDAEGFSATFGSAVGDPRIQVKTKLTKDVQKLESGERRHAHAVTKAAEDIKQINQQVTVLERQLRANQGDADSYANEAGRPFVITLDGKTYHERGEADVALNAMGKIKQIDRTVGTYRGFSLAFQGGEYGQVSTLRLIGKSAYGALFSTQSLDGTLRGIKRFASNTADQISKLGMSRTSLEDLRAKPFARKPEMEMKRARLKGLESDMQANPEPPPPWLRDGAPVGSTVLVDGKDYAVAGHRVQASGYSVLIEDGDIVRAVPIKDVHDDQGGELFAGRDAAPVAGVPSVPSVPEPSADAGPVAQGDLALNDGRPPGENSAERDAAFFIGENEEVDPAEPGDLSAPAARRFANGNVPLRINPAPLPPVAGAADKLHEIILDFGKALSSSGVGTTEFTTAGRRAQQKGVYRPSNGQTSIRHNNLDAAAHEIGHRIDDFFPVSIPATSHPPAMRTWKKAMKELHWFSYFGSLPDPGLSVAGKKAYLRAEGWAEWLRAFIVNPQAATAAAPGVAAMYASRVPAPVRAAVEAYSVKVREFAGRKASAKTTANVKGIKDATSSAGIGGQLRAIAGSIRDYVHRAAGDVGDSRVRGGVSMPSLKDSQLEITLKDKVTFGWYDSWWPAIKGYRLALSLKNGPAPLIENDFETLVRIQSGFADRMDSMFIDGLVDPMNKPIIDAHTGRRVNVEWLLGPSTEAGLTKAEAEAELDHAMAQGVEERTVEEGLRNLSKAQAAAAAFRAALWQANPNDPDIGKKSFAFLKQKVREAREANAKLTGIAGGLDSDYEQARTALRERMRDTPEVQSRRREILRRYRLWANEVLDYAVAAGALGKDQALGMKKSHQAYIDLHRVMESETSSLPNKKFLGSSRTIDNPLLNLMHATWSTMQWADANRVRKSFIDALEVPRGLHQGAPVDLHVLGSRVTDDEMKRMEEGGKRDAAGKIDGKKPYPVREIITQANPVTGVMEQVAVTQWWTFDASIEAGFEAVHAFDNPGAVEQLANGLKTLTQKMITLSPPFLIRQVQRDTVSRLITTEAGSSVLDLIDGYGELAGKNVLERYRSSGAGQSGYGETGKAAYERRLLGVIHDAVHSDNVIVTTARKLGRGYMKLAAESDLANRRAEFARAWKSRYAKEKDDGTHEDLAQMRADLYAAKHARGLMDFQVAGHYARRINKIIVFFNAGMQATRRLARALGPDHRKTTVARVILLGTASALLKAAMNALMSDDDRKEGDQRPSYKRDFAWSFKIGDNLWLDIAKPYEWGVIASGFERVMDAAMGKKNAFEGYPQSLLTALLPFKEEHMAGAFKPFIETSLNKSWFTGRHIVSPHDDRKDLDQRKGTSNSSPLGQALQSVLGVDARKIDYLAQSTLGGFGRIATARSSDPGWWLAAATGMTSRSATYDAADVAWVLEYAERRGIAGRKAFDTLRDKLKLSDTATNAAERDQYARAAREHAMRLRNAIEANPAGWNGEGRTQERD